MNPVQRAPSWRVWLLAASLAIAIITTACSGEPGGPPAIDAASAPHAISATDTVGCTNTTFSFRKCWPSNSTIAIRVPESIAENAYKEISNAVIEWQALLAEGTFTAPKLSINRGTGGNVDVAFAATSQPATAGHSTETGNTTS